MAIDYKKWDKIYNVSEKDVEAVKSNDGEKKFEDVPFGKYEVKVTLLELGETKTGKLKIAARFKVLKGSQKGRIIFYNKTLNTDPETQPRSIHFANVFLRSLESGVDIKWNGSICDYADTIEQVFNEIENDVEYTIDYYDNKGFGEVKILEAFDVDSDDVPF